MVIPVVGASPQDAPAPAAVKEFHSYFWWGIFLILVSMAMLQVVAGDGFGMFFTLILAAIVYYMVSDHCANMSMYCLLVFGLISGFESLFGVLTLFSVVGGRSSSTTLITSKDATSVTYETQVKVHPLFDSTQGSKYNIQSGLLVALPVVMLLSALLSWWSFRAYPNSLFSDFDEEAEPIYAQGGPPASQALKMADEELHTEFLQSPAKAMCESHMERVDAHVDANALGKPKIQLLAASDIDIDGLAKISLQSSSSHSTGQAASAGVVRNVQSWPLAKLTQHYEIQEPSIQDLPGVRLAADQSGAVYRLSSLRKPCGRLRQEKLRAHVAQLQAQQFVGTARILAVYEDSRSMALVTELCSGGTVQDRILQRNVFSEQECAMLIKHMLEPLHEIHQAGLSHGHLSPESFRFQSDQTQAPLKLVDFGLELKVCLDEWAPDSGHSELLTPSEARVRHWPRSACPQLYETCRLVFCAPEVLKHFKVGSEFAAPSNHLPAVASLKPGVASESSDMLDLRLLSEAIDAHMAQQDCGWDFLAACDVWSVGAIAFLLLCGYPPFFAPCRHAIISRVEKIDLSFDPPFWSKISEEAKDFVQRCLHGTAAKRLTVQQALQHPWIRQLADTSPYGSMLPSFALNLRRFCRTWLIEAFVANSLASKLSYMDTLELQRECQKADKDNSGFLTSADLRQVLQQGGHADIVEAIGLCFARFLRHPGESYLDYHALLDSVRLRREFLIEEEIWTALLQEEGTAEPAAGSMESFLQAPSLQKILQREGVQDGCAMSAFDESGLDTSKADINDFMAKVLSQLRSFAHAVMQRSLSKE
ncbi:CPK28 [Symbiodinium natans]|uniref:CPK28 protein n=1 Tax=Symbiodinium natans TaxID=878477 RepID=A0A812PJF2_9DINO|nr:CPK28 [Symbiodinium natans]